jgi:hypothetical protein
MESQQNYNKINNKVYFCFILIAFIFKNNFFIQIKDNKSLEKKSLRKR